MIACLVWRREKSVCNTCLKSPLHSEHDSLMKLYYLHLRRKNGYISWHDDVNDRDSLIPKPGLCLQRHCYAEKDNLTLRRNGNALLLLSILHLDIILWLLERKS
jgi:hypothetical protein